MVERHLNPTISSGVYNSVQRYSIEESFDGPMCGTVRVSILITVELGVELIIEVMMTIGRLGWLSCH